MTIEPLQAGRSALRLPETHTSLWPSCRRERLIPRARACSATVTITGAWWHLDIENRDAAPAVIVAGE